MKKINTPDQGKQESAKVASDTKGPFIYLGPAVRTATLHLEPRQILKQKPVIPKKFDFLDEFVVPIKDHGGLKQQLSAKYQATARRLATALKPKKE